MSSKSLAFVFVPGGWCPGYYYHKVVSLLEAKGYQARAVDHPSMDAALRETGETPGLYDDAAQVRAVISSYLDKGSDVVLVGSSYGGAVSMEASKGITAAERVDSQGGQLKHLVMLGSLLSEQGRSVGEVVGSVLPMDNFVQGQTYHEPLEPAVVSPLLFGALPKEEQDKYSCMAKSICFKAMIEPLTFTAWQYVPTTLVIGDKDAMLPPAIQHEFFEKAVANGTKGLREIIIEGGDHLPMLSFPEEIVRVCLEAGGVSD